MSKMHYQTEIYVLKYIDKLLAVENAQMQQQYNFVRNY